MCKYSLEENQLPLDIENYLSFLMRNQKGHVPCLVGSCLLGPTFKKFENPMCQFFSIFFQPKLSISLSHSFVRWVFQFMYFVILMVGEKAGLVAIKMGP